MKKIVLLSLSTWLLASCASSPYPLNMSEEQWQKLTPEERHTMLLKQQEYRETQRLESIKANARQRELDKQLELKEQERLNRLYSHPGGGDVVRFNIYGGEYRYKKQIYQLQPFSTLIARGETKEIDLQMRDYKHHNHRERAYLKYNPDGTGIYLYLSHPSHYNNDYIALLRDRSWECGAESRQSFQFSKHEALKGMKFYVEELNSNCRNPKRYR
ncbi:hypothetical protein QCB45_04850 [Thiomicrorhabdus sp. ZW0627]|uniref:hypothetical protein n=1 Tax=Thiomicrorhabdus sp. ZW0627 TaxID=3039774 RepID=UPI0024370591|nr:hypothetical protein [Thiomicrorhabdus sp. ZW0627]MDG6773651.1 hypothetical protein [Thiomicrorhabdus sp. ZW0627]